MFWSLLCRVLQKFVVQFNSHGDVYSEWQIIINLDCRHYFYANLWCATCYMGEQTCLLWLFSHRIFPLTSTMKWLKLKRPNQHVESVSSQPRRLKFKNQGNGGHILQFWSYSWSQPLRFKALGTFRIVVQDWVVFVG